MIFSITRPSNKPVKRLSLYLFLIFFTLQTPSLADDIRDFQIEGMSVGGSLLEYMSQTEITNNHVNMYHPKSKFIVINYPKTNIYEYLYIYVKRNDENYKIHLLRGMNQVKNKSSCLKNKKEIVQVLKSLFTNATFHETKQNHYYYKKAKQYISQFEFGKEGKYSDGARVECLIISKEEQKKYNIFSTLEVIIQYGDEVQRWLESGDAR